MHRIAGADAGNHAHGPGRLNFVDINDPRRLQDAQMRSLLGLRHQTTQVRLSAFPQVILLNGAVAEIKEPQPEPEFSVAGPLDHPVPLQNHQKTVRGAFVQAQGCRHLRQSQRGITLAEQIQDRKGAVQSLYFVGALQGFVSQYGPRFRFVDTLVSRIVGPMSSSNTGFPAICNHPRRPIREPLGKKSPHPGTDSARLSFTEFSYFLPLITMTTENLNRSAANLPWAYFRLRPFPQIAIRVMQLANREDVPLHKLSGLIGSDPAFSSEVLTIANSPLYAPRVPATSILQAVARLGTRCIQGLCITVGVRTYLGKTLSEPAMQSIWRHNMACALIAEQIALVSGMDKDTAYTAGVVHDIGRLALAAIRPKEYTVLLERHTGTAASILDAERELFGVDHCEAGKQLITDWMLPYDFEAIVSQHHVPGHKDGSWNLGDVVDLSCRMADTAGFKAFAGCEALPYADLMEELPAPQRAVFHATAETLSQDILAKIHAVESA